jgi:hypothetical protein
MAYHNKKRTEAISIVLQTTIWRVLLIYIRNYRAVYKGEVSATAH